MEPTLLLAQDRTKLLVPGPMRGSIPSSWEARQETSTTTFGKGTNLFDALQYTIPNIFIVYLRQTMSLERGEDGSYSYCRSTHKLYNEASSLLGKCYSDIVTTNYVASTLTPSTILFPSGNAAINTALTAAIKLFKEPYLVCDTVMYNDSKRCIAQLETLYPKLTVFRTNLSQVQEAVEVLKSLRNKSVVLFAETCTNPEGNRLNGNLLKALKERGGSWHVVLDNSLLSHVRCNPFSCYNTYIDNKNITVAISCSKHVSAGSCIAGAVFTWSKKMLNKIYSLYSFRGYHVAPETCQHLLDAIPSMRERCRASSILCGELVKRLVKQPIHGTTVQHRAAQFSPEDFNPVKHAQALPDIVNLRIAVPEEHGITREKVHQAIAGNGVFALATSYGGKATRICNYIDIGPTHYCIRVSCGYENGTEMGTWFRALKLHDALNHIIQSIGSSKKEKMTSVAAKVILKETGETAEL